ncbi:hypothetical protein [Jannaschia aquimarina]|uniref:Uncharacterized protein n=1 Tax=Jannaschia aquimarina TaxID=935700 RepID=A0A0D1EEP2_9RHOB|nr:hypothetical protein [Jannaschia aquimarina]KIT15331.1 hypothetical protein jaqu_29460 [Jannaschia aquimarina]SNS51427.1 hypothetical protein SAMN05421775_101260 [Jannaschia aquimarina]
MIATASSASAEDATWTAFRTYCLGPMEAVALTHPTDLVALSNQNVFGVTPYADATLDWTLSVSGSSAETGHVSGAPTRCIVESRTNSALTANAFLFWTSRPETISRYETVSAEGTSLTLRSTTWREPRMEVEMTLSGADEISLTARETDLES